MMNRYHIPDSIDRLYGQFFITTLSINEWFGWKKYDNGRIKIFAEKHLSIHFIKDQRGNSIGYLLGCVISHEAGIVDGDIQIQLPVNNSNIEDAIEKTIYNLGGRFIAIILRDNYERLYLDPGGLLAGVYSQKYTVAAATTSLLNSVVSNYYKNNVTFPKPENIGIDQFYPAGLTSYEGICRCLPNHYLNLKDFTLHRHWPKKEPERIPESNIRESVEYTGKLINNIVSAVAMKQQAYSTLTAGKDSRVVLACMRNYTSQFEYFTFDYLNRNTRNSRNDKNRSLTISNKLNLNHRFIPVIETDETVDTNNYLYRIGYDGNKGKAYDFWYSCNKYLDLGKPLITGFAGEVGKPFYWRTDDKENSKLTPELLLKRMNLPANPKSVEWMKNWLKKLSEFSNWTILDLLYIENRLGAWCGVHMYGFAPFKYIISPFNHRSIYEQMISLPTTYKFKKLLFNDIIKTRWPELLNFPYDDNYTRFRKVTSKVFKFKNIKKMVGI